LNSFIVDENFGTSEIHLIQMSLIATSFYSLNSFIVDENFGTSETHLIQMSLIATSFYS